jgi:hypothetical protein
VLLVVFFCGILLVSVFCVHIGRTIDKISKEITQVESVSCILEFGNFVKVLSSSLYFPVHSLDILIFHRQFWSTFETPYLCSDQSSVWGCLWFNLVLGGMNAKLYIKLLFPAHSAFRGPADCLIPWQPTMQGCRCVKLSWWGGRPRRRWGPQRA